MPRRRAITLIEVLAVLAILSVLMAILAPAVQQARETARRTDCQNRLRQLGLALHTYESSHRVFPSGATLGGWSWRTMILPQLEQKATYDLIDFSNNRKWPEGYFDCIPETMRLTQEHGVWHQVKNPWMCPSDPVEGLRGSTSYMGIGGNRDRIDWEVFRDYYPGDELESPGNGMLYLCSSTRVESATDGASQTLIVGERGHDLDELHGNDGVRITCTYSRGVPNAWTTTGVPRGTLNNRNVFFWSYHSGGTHFLFVDGHVQRLNDNMDIRVFHALGSRNGGEVAGEF